MERDNLHLSPAVRATASVSGTGRNHSSRYLIPHFPLRSRECVCTGICDQWSRASCVQRTVLRSYGRRCLFPSTARSSSLLFGSGRSMGKDLVQPSGSVDGISLQCVPASRCCILSRLSPDGGVFPRNGNRPELANRFLAGTLSSNSPDLRATLCLAKPAS